MIALSYLFYTTVILWVEWMPLLGNAFIAYQALYNRKGLASPA